MSLNTSHANGGVLIFNTERILLYHDGVEMSFEMPGSSDLPHFKGTKKGRIYLTTHRVIFNSKDMKETLQSFSMPFFAMKEVELEQPVFGANYIKGRVKAESGGNWSGDGKFKMWFNHGGAIEFGQAMLHAGRMASRYFPPQPPVYTPPTANYYQAPPPAYAPPTGQAYHFVPYASFPTAPPADGVYMYDAPPPYPGIDPHLAPYPSPQAGGYANAPPPGAYGQAPPPPGINPQPYANGHQMSAAAAKEAEANATNNAAYYNPADPHNVYMPTPYHYESPQYDNPNGQQPSAPPTYSEATKKNE